MQKNKLSIFLLCIVICFSFVLASCDQSTPVYNAIRWEDTESFVFDVSLALEADDHGFKYEYDDLTFVNNSEMIADDGSYDQFCPSSIVGTFSADISTVGEVQTFSTVQNIQCTYLAEDLELFDTLKSHVDQLSNDEQDIVQENTSTKIVLLSSTTTTVKFKKINLQTPISSEKTIKGFYAGRLHFEVNDFSISTTYEENVATVTQIEKGVKTIDAQQRTLSTSAYIDASQLFLYQRSLDQSTVFTQTPTVAVYDPVSNRMMTFSFSMSMDTPVILPNMNTQNNLASITSVGVYTALSMQNAYAYIFFNNPVDEKFSTAGPLNKFTTVKFQSGFMLYELSSYTAEQVEQLEYKPSVD